MWQLILALATLAMVIVTVIVNRRTSKTLSLLVDILEKRKVWSLGESYEKSVQRREIPDRESLRGGVVTDLYPKEK